MDFQSENADETPAGTIELCETRYKVRDNYGSMDCRGYRLYRLDLDLGVHETVGIWLMIIVSVRDKYQMTLPKSVRKTFDLAVGDRLYFAYAEGRFLVSSRRPTSSEAMIVTKIRDRFQVTLPVKKFRARTAFSNTSVLISPTDNSGFSIRALPPDAKFIFREFDAKPTEKHDPPISRHYPSRRGGKT